MTFKVPKKGRKETSKSKQSEFPENQLQVGLKDCLNGPEAQAYTTEASMEMRSC